MGYKNGKDVLPAKLLKELQKYIQGELIYIPKECHTRAAWGENNGTRKIIIKRNKKIFDLYKNGTSINALTKMYNLSQDSIRKIIYKNKNIYC